MSDEVVLLISVAGSLASVGGFLVAALQTIRLRKVKERAEGDLWESVRVTREVLRELEEGTKEAAVAGAAHLRSHLIKELVLQQGRCDSRRLDQWKADSKITDEELGIAKQFILSEPPSLSERFADAITRRFKSSRRSSELLRIVKELGIAGAPEKFPSDLISTGISQAKKKVKISTTWIHGMPSLELALSEAAKRCPVEILLLDPRSEAARQRSIDLEFTDSEDVPRQIRGTLAWLKKILPAQTIAAGHVKVGLYRTAPGFLMYLFDDTIVYCSALRGNKLACARRQLVVRGQETELYKTMEEQFSLLAKRADLVDLSEWSPNPAAQTDGSAAA